MSIVRTLDSVTLKRKAQAKSNSFRQVFQQFVKHSFACKREGIFARPETSNYLLQRYLSTNSPNVFVPAAKAKKITSHACHRTNQTNGIHIGEMRVVGALTERQYQHRISQFLNNERTTTRTMNACTHDIATRRTVARSRSARHQRVPARAASAAE